MTPLIAVARITVSMPDDVSAKTSSWIRAAIEVEMESYVGPHVRVDLKSTDLGWTVSVSGDDDLTAIEPGLLEAYVRARIVRALTNAGVDVIGGLRDRSN